MKANQNFYTIEEMAGLFGVSRGAYYKWNKAGSMNQRNENDARILTLILEIVIKNQWRYGSPRVKRDLFKIYGICVNHKKVARLMREHGLNARRRKKYIPTTDSKHSFPICKNILNREFYAEKPGQKWVSDITYLRTENGWVYLTVVIDLFDRRVIGWALSTDLGAGNTTIAAFEMAVKNRNMENDLIFHSDRGVQYCAEAFINVIRKHCPGINQSMSGKGNCWDNACAESFFKTLKTEEVKTNGKYSAADVRQGVFYYIEAYYNRERSHSSLDYLSPNEYYLSKVA
jgi:transposase InsO family protein